MLAIPLGLLIGWLRGGNTRNLENSYIRGLSLVLIAFLLRFLVNSPDLAKDLNIGFLIVYFPFINIFAYIVLLIFAYLNLRLISIRVFAFGTLLNAIPIVLNGGKMPFELNEARKVGMAETLIKLSKEGSANIPSNRDALFWPLGDLIPLRGIRFYKLVSIGDIVLFFALVLLISELMLDKSKKDV
ncbi:MAG: DUF5317 domain-containing protein [Actinobacteria bacterium]|nr:DUF5317 domain-containing protein [Actinomycetota bacterium]